MEARILIDQQDVFDLIAELSVNGEIAVTELFIGLSGLHHFFCDRNGEVKPIMSRSELRRITEQMRSEI